MKNVSIKHECLIKFILIALIFLFVLVECILAFTPPISRDALIHHLAIPKLWILHRGFYDTPWAVYSYYPMNVDLLYLIPLYFGNDIIPNFIHLSFSIGTAFLIYAYLNKRLGHLAGLLGAFVFISIPMVVRTSTTAYVDIGLVFFITACVMSFFCWRDDEYKNNGWLFISAVAMGLALGTKYNALPAWFFLSLAVVFIYSKETGGQWGALKHGLIFVVLSLAVFSPWLIKNAVLTGNPFYPLFKGIFGSREIINVGTYSAVSGDIGRGMFKMREILYGESLWESLLIPIRFFLQGQDHSWRYFDGVLNPMLILISPFAFINRKLKADKLFFLSFSVFFILLAFFLDQHRIRYILPAIPFVVILTVMGFANLFNWMMEKPKPFRSFCMVIFAFVLISMVVINAVYAKNYFMKIAPVDFILKKESRDEFISRHDGSYPAVKFINDHTPENSRIKLILLAGRGYHLNRSYDDNASFGMDIIRDFVISSSDPKVFQQYLKSLNCTHLLMRYDLFQQFLQQNYSPGEIKQLSEVLEKTTRIIFRDNYYAVFQLVI